MYNVSKAALPLLKAQGGGIVVQFPSIGGRVGGSAGLGSYQAAKFAIDGLTRALATETAPFGIRYLVVEPSGFATDWAGASMDIQDVPPEYQATVGAFNDRARGSRTTGDPDRAAGILVRVVKRDHLPTHLPLGANAARMALDYSRQQLAEAEAWQAVSVSADFGAQYPVGLPADTEWTGRIVQRGHAGFRPSSCARTSGAGPCQRTTSKTFFCRPLAYTSCSTSFSFWVSLSVALNRRLPAPSRRGKTRRW